VLTLLLITITQRLWSFIFHPRIFRPTAWLCRRFLTHISLRKLGCLGCWRENFDDQLSRFDKIPDRDRQTDRQMDRQTGRQTFLTANIAIMNSIAGVKLANRASLCSANVLCGWLVFIVVRYFINNNMTKRTRFPFVATYVVSYVAVRTCESPVISKYLLYASNYWGSWRVNAISIDSVCSQTQPQDDRTLRRPKPLRPAYSAPENPDGHINTYFRRTVTTDVANCVAFRDVIPCTVTLCILNDVP